MLCKKSEECEQLKHSLVCEKATQLDLMPNYVGVKFSSFPANLKKEFQQINLRNSVKSHANVKKKGRF